MKLHFSEKKLNYLSINFIIRKENNMVCILGCLGLIIMLSYQLLNWLNFFKMSCGKKKKKKEK